MNVLVTGGAGYIGSRTVHLMQQCGHTVVVLDSMEFGHRRAVGAAPLIEGDIRDTSLLDEIFREHAIDAVIHFAGYKAAGESMEHPERYFDTNVCGTASLLQAMRKASIRYFVFSSSCAVYGTPETLPVSEETALHPENPYGESKLMVEQMLRWYGECSGLRYASLRYFNATGASLDGQAGEDWTYALNLIPLVLKAAMGIIPRVTVFGTDYPTPDGTAIRDYIHVLDLADAHVKALAYLADGNPSVTLNLGTGKGTSVQEVIDCAKSVTGVDIPVEYVGRRPGDPVAVYADTGRARDVLKWNPRFALPEIIESAWRWHVSHPKGYQDG